MMHDLNAVIKSSVWALFEDSLTLSADKRNGPLFNGSGPATTLLPLFDLPLTHRP